MTTLPTAKVFFDTQICINAANKAISEEDWREATEYIQKVAEYWISPLSVGEIVLGIAKGDERHFENGKTRLRKIYSEGARHFFDFPRYFLAKTLGFEAKRPANLEDDFGFSIQVILLAESKSELLSGVAIPYLTTGVKIRIDRFLQEIEAIQQRFVQLVSTLKGTKKFTLAPEQWAERALSFYGIEEDEAARNRFLKALYAAYQFDTVLLDLARNRNYDLQKNVSDIVDTQQLIYLCDPTVVFVTDDSDFKKRLRGNAQSGRIVAFREVLRRARNQESLLQEHPTTIALC
jgi:hypothetical protein